MSGFLQVVTTVASRDEGDRLAKILVEERLAACVQVIGPIHSTYRWDGDVKVSEEWQCQIKSRAEVFNALKESIRKHHSYDVPEILAVPIGLGNADYLSWIEKNVSLPH
ncbi:MAG: divalent-cation tolerance protein CutA [Cyanobacteria bacterium J06639_1]